MKRFLLVLVLLIATHEVVKSNTFNSKEWWSRLVFETELSVTNTAAIDSSIVVVTNRFATGDKLRFMSEEVGDGELMYFYVYASQGKWHVLQRNSLREAVNLIPKKDKDWVVYTEGMGKIFPSELNRGMMMASQYDVNVVMLDYPSITTTKGMLGNYFFAIHNARQAYEYHQPVLVDIRKMKEAGALGLGKLTLFFHSMGNILLEEIVEHNLLQPLNDKHWVDNLVLNAACVDADDHADWLRYVFFAERIYVHYNPDDRVLKGASIPAFETQLGKDPGYPIVTAAIYINFNKIVKNQHSYFLTLQGRQPVFEGVFQHYSTVLHGNEPDLAGGDGDLYQPSDHHGIGYDLISFMP